MTGKFLNKSYVAGCYWLGSEVQNIKGGTGSNGMCINQKKIKFVV